MTIKNQFSFIVHVLCICIAEIMITTNSFAQTNASNNQTTTSNMENTNGTTITLGGNPVHTIGKLPAVGTDAKDFTLTALDLTEKTFADFKGKYIIMNIFPSVNTGVCSKSVRTFNMDVSKLHNTTVLCISKDLPFAQKQFCGSEGIDHVVMLSDFRSDFGSTYGVLMVDGAFKGLLSRAVIVIDPEGKIIYEEQVPEIGQEPNYEAALAVVK